MAIGVGIVGSGIFVREEHLQTHPNQKPPSQPAVLSTPTLNLRAIYSRSSASAAALQQTSPKTTSIDIYSDDAGPGKAFTDLLKRVDIDAVIIALPIMVQPAFIKQALEVGKHVLSEKPIAKDVDSARELLTWYESSGVRAMWSVGENMRFFETVQHGAQEVKKLGRVLGFNVRVMSMVREGDAYYGMILFSARESYISGLLLIDKETTWRKTPEYNGGFVLDAGIHQIAGIRALLGEDDPPVRVIAFTRQLQNHLPPVDTVDAIIRTKSGVTGSLSMSFGTTYEEYFASVACEQGVVLREKGGKNFAKGSSGILKVREKGEEKVMEFPDEAMGVKQEMAAWAQALQDGHVDPRQAPEAALQDLQMLEAMLQSGEHGGQPVDLGLS
ncbi:MAG: hypothetical protein M1820_001083 [Bogoriella megaspora]|nr:MAG: hypothetical protein M1820_001083 [Bogoriella megaspora]